MLKHLTTFRVMSESLYTRIAKVREVCNPILQINNPKSSSLLNLLYEKKYYNRILRRSAGGFDNLFTGTKTCFNAFASASGRSDSNAFAVKNRRCYK